MSYNFGQGRRQLDAVATVTLLFSLTEKDAETQLNVATNVLPKYVRSNVR